MEESSFLDVLSICKRFIDIYSFGIKVTDADGKPLTNDKEFLNFLKEHEDKESLSLYLYKDLTVQPLLFKLPRDNPSLVSSASPMRDVMKDNGINPHMELYRELTLHHMDTLWTACWSSLNKNYVKTFKTKALVLKNVPPGMNNKDWEWLATNKFLSDKFQGGKVDTPPDIAKIFQATRQKKGKFSVPSEQEKYVG